MKIKYISTNSTVKRQFSTSKFSSDHSKNGKWYYTIGRGQCIIEYMDRNHPGTSPKKEWTGNDNSKFDITTQKSFKSKNKENKGKPPNFSLVSDFWVQEYTGQCLWVRKVDTRKHTPCTCN